MSKQQKYPSDEFRQKTVRLLASSGKSVPELVRKTGARPQRDEQLVEDALLMALQCRKVPTNIGLLHHTDCGSQYTANDYLKHLPIMAFKLA